MKQKSKLHQQEHATAEQTVTHATGTAEFRSAEELVRFDAAQTPVPEAVKSRLADSVAREPRPAASKPWWKRLLS